MSEPVNATDDPNKDPLRRMTNQDLWNNFVHWTPESEFRTDVMLKELERRLRRTAFLRALPPKEDA